MKKHKEVLENFIANTGVPADVHKSICFAIELLGNMDEEKIQEILTWFKESEK